MVIRIFQRPGYHETWWKFRDHCLTASPRPSATLPKSAKVELRGAPNTSILLVWPHSLDPVRAGYAGKLAGGGVEGDPTRDPAVGETKIVEGIEQAGRGHIREAQHGQDTQVEPTELGFDTAGE